MAINLNSSSSQAAVDSVSAAEQNKNKVADGFDDGMDLNFDDLLADYNETGLDSGDGLGGGLGGLGGGLGSGADSMGIGGMNNGLGGMGGLGGGIGTGMNNLGIAGQLGQGLPGQQQASQPKQPGITDLLSESALAATKATGNILKDFVKSFPTITYDDYASFWMDVLIVGAIIGITGIIMNITGAISANTVLKGFGRLFAPMGLIPMSISFIGFGVAAIGVLDHDSPDTSLANIEDQALKIDSLPEDTTSDTLDEEYSALLSSFEFDDDDEDMFPTEDSSSSDDFDFFNTPAEEPEPASVNNMDNSSLLDSMNTLVPKIDRQYLLDNFISFLPVSCAEYGKTEKITDGSSEFNSIRSLLLQAISNVSKIPLEDLNLQIQSIEGTVFSYTILIDRVKSLNKINDLEREIEVYFRENATDSSVICTIETEHGFWKISITKGASPMVSVRDCLKDEKVLKYFKDTSHFLPFIAGIDTYGNPILTCGENYTSMLTAGKQRSGKSWYICSVLMQMMLVNVPFDVQMLFIDPKKTSLYRTFSCMPHTIGVHSDEDIVALLRYILEVEGERRKELLRKANHGLGVDSIKAYRAEGHKDMPYLYIVIDEFLTAIGNAESKGVKKEFNQLISMIITQLPFVGIHLWIIPHRAQGAVDKTVRANILFTAGFRCDNAIAKEIIDDEWGRPLNGPGDAVLKLQDIGKPQFMRAAVFARDDAENTQIIMDIAKGMYKIGVETPQIDYGILANKDLNYICTVLDLSQEQREKLIANTIQSNIKTPSNAGLPAASTMQGTYREAHNSISDLLNISDFSEVLPEETAQAATQQQTTQTATAQQTSEDVITDEDEEMLSRWRDYMDEEEQSAVADQTASPIDTSSWDDDTSPFDNM